MQNKINDFFKEYPEATEVHCALGVLFPEQEEAESFLGGVEGQKVETIVRPAVVAEDPNALQTETPAAEVPQSEVPPVSAKNKS